MLKLKRIIHNLIKILKIIENADFFWGNGDYWGCLGAERIEREC